MCLYPLLIKNPKYRPNKKNNYHPAKAKDNRITYVPVGCGKCIECKRQKANSWRVRLEEELTSSSLKAFMICLTFSEESLNYLYEENENTTAKKAVRNFLERWRKKYKKSLRHWLITELGHEGTERIHLHGIIFCTEEQIAELEKIWTYGWVHIGTFVNTKTINYIIKYVTKNDNDHPWYEQIILCSPGIGKNYIQRGKNFNKFNDENTKEYYITKNGTKINLPIYYRNNIYTEEEREKLWINKLNQQEIYITGTKYEIKSQKDIKNYLKALINEQKKNERTGYSKPKWSIEKYVENLYKINNLSTSPKNNKKFK